jgi:hypothetical protein
MPTVYVTIDRLALRGLEATSLQTPRLAALTEAELRRVVTPGRWGGGLCDRDRVRVDAPGIATSGAAQLARTVAHGIGAALAGGRGRSSNRG